MAHWIGTLKNRLDRAQHHWIEAIRIFLGAALFMKGVYFVTHIDVALGFVDAAHLPYASAALAHAIGIAHLGGGMMLMLGLMTRLAAAVQLPVVVGALVFVHLREGLFSNAGTVEFVVLVAFLLAIFSLRGARSFTLDGVGMSPAESTSGSQTSVESTSARRASASSAIGAA